MSWRSTVKDDIPITTRRTREEALAWAHQLVAKGVRVIKLRSINARRRDRQTALPSPKIEMR